MVSSDRFFRLRAALRAQDLDSEFQQELDVHLAMLEDDDARSGSTAEDAARARADSSGLCGVAEDQPSRRARPPRAMRVDPVVALRSE